MRLSPIVKDKRSLIKLVRDATKLKCFEAFIRYSSEGSYRSITCEYEERTFPHITIAQGSWSIQEGGEYKISIYLPCMTIGQRKNFNVQLFRSYIDKIRDAIDERFGEDNWNSCNTECANWRPLSRCSFYIQIPNFEDYGK